jgi:pyrroline-5-carboxylate reductase
LLHRPELQERVDLVDLKYRLGIIGAGHLGDAIAKTWHARTGDPPLVWSRSGPRRQNESRAAMWVTNWSGLLETESLVIAIPGRSLLELVEGSSAARQFKGNVFSAAASLTRASLKRVFPQAAVVCFSPFLIDGVNSIPMLVLRPSDLSLSQWLQAKTELENLGEFDVIEDEHAFEQVALLGASWPAVMLAVLQTAADAGVAGVADENARRMGRRIFFRAIKALLHQGKCHEVATPGGITERGLNSLPLVTNHFAKVFAQMQARAAELRV